MENIIKIFISDIKRLSRNVVAIVVIMGLTVLPSLYAWFNILSNWDPYGEDSTSRIKVAIASDDEGTQLAGADFNVSDKIIEALKTNNSIGWVFTDSSKEAVDGVYRGDYYAALVIPKGFSSDMVSFLTDSMQHPTIDYYCNEKKNAIAPKITDKAKNTVKQQINATFISTIAESLVGVADSASKSDAAESAGITDQNSFLDVLIAKLSGVRIQLDTYDTVLDTFISIADSASTTINTAGSATPDIDAQVAKEKAAIDNLQKVLESGPASLSDVSKTLSDNLSSIQSVMSSVSAAYASANGSMNAFDQSIKEGKDNLVATKQMIGSLKEELDKTLSQLTQIRDGDGYAMLSSLMSSDPQQVGQFISTPVDMQIEHIYPVATYGSAMSPFFTVLSLWVGALILVAIIHVQVKPQKEIKHVKAYQAFFGRYITFYIIGQAQTLLIVLGNLYYIGIQCLNPFKFWFMASFTSFVFTLIMYSLTFAFENVGEALAVVIMVIQVAGAGGTFPVEVLPGIYQAIYKFLPFTYAMNGMRETIAGMYGIEYWKCIGALAIFALVALFIGLVLSIPWRKMNHLIEKSKEKSGVLL